jgi:hypothetical protein
MHLPPKSQNVEQRSRGPGEPLPDSLGGLGFPNPGLYVGQIVGHSRKASPEGLSAKRGRLAARTHQVDVSGAGPAPQFEHLGPGGAFNPTHCLNSVGKHPGGDQRRANGLQHVFLGDLVVKVPTGVYIWEDRDTFILQGSDDLPRNK